MKKSKLLIIIMIAIITLVIGFSFASWIITLTQTNTNIIGSKCFNITYSDHNPINLQSAYPITDTEGAELTPYDFTITNTCDTYASYQVNLEILNTTDLAQSEVRVMVDNDTPVNLSEKRTTTKTLNNASSAYILKEGYLNPNESVTYNLRLWIKEDSTTEASANKTFSSKITITSGYKEANPTTLERCYAMYGENSAICSFIAQANTASSNCLQTSNDGSIVNPYSTIADTADPIICSMEDDYGTSYYLRGLHTTNNVKFADSCWKIIRTTGNGGIKLLYNGDVDGSGTCTTSSGSHDGFIGQTLTLSGDKKYGSDYTKSGSTYTLTNVETLNWPNNSESIIGKYTCGNTNTSCSTLYAVTGEYTDEDAYALKMAQSVNYAAIGTGAFYADYDSPAYAGYMFKTVYTYISRLMAESGITFLSSASASSSNYYYGDKLNYVLSYPGSNYYKITNEDGSDVQQLSWASNYQNNLVGKYTCKGTTKASNTELHCETAYKVLDTTTKSGYMIAEILKNGMFTHGNINVADSYSYDGTNFTLTNPVSLDLMQWYNNYSTYKGYFACEDWQETTCSKLYQLAGTSQTGFGTRSDVGNNFYYGSSFTYNRNAERPYTLVDTVQFFNTLDSTNKTNLNTHHYTCFYSSDNTCDTLYYIFGSSGNYFYYVKLNGNETVTDVLNKMIGNNDINVKESHIKGAVDWWYENNILNTPYENYLDDTIYCNDREVYHYGGWDTTKALSGTLSYNVSRDKYYLKCSGKRDSFTTNDAIHGNGALDYPIGLITAAETSLIGNYTAENTTAWYWTSTPSTYGVQSASQRAVRVNGHWDGNWTVQNNGGIRPVITLKTGIKFTSTGDGSASNPYEVDMSS